MSATAASRPDAFTCPPAGSVLEAAEKAFEASCANAATPDPAAIRRTVVSALVQDGMPPDLQGKWLDSLIDSRVAVVGMTLEMMQARHRAPSRRNKPDPFRAAFATLALIQARRSTSSLERALTQAATAIGPGVSVDELRAAASWFLSLFYSSSPQQQEALIASLDVIRHEIPPLLAGDNTMFLVITTQEFYAVAGLLDELRGV